MACRAQQQPTEYLAELPKTTACFDVSKPKLHDSLIRILNTCNLQVFGYNSHYDAFWGKKTQETGGQYSFELSLISISETNTQVKIETLLGNSIEAIAIIASIKEAISNTPRSHSHRPVARTATARV